MNARQRDPQFEESVRRAFAFLSSGAEPKVVRSEYDPNVFGNAVVELEGEKLRVRVVRDRSQIFVELAPLGYGEWFDEHIVLQSVGAGAEAQALVKAKWRNVKVSAKAIAPNIDAIVSRFDQKNWKTTQADLTARRERRGKEFAEQLRALALADAGSPRKAGPRCRR